MKRGEERIREEEVEEEGQEMCAEIKGEEEKMCS